MVQKKPNDDLYRILRGTSLLLFLSWDSDVSELVFHERGPRLTLLCFLFFRTWQEGQRVIEMRSLRKGASL